MGRSMFAGTPFAPLHAWEKRLSPAGWLGRVHSDHLTAICYHRVWPAANSRFRGYKPNISATPDAFARQIDYLREHYNPISIRELADWLNGTGGLPPRPMLITFDDGYRDNGDIAWPILRERGVPAVVFLATDHIGSGRPFVWDFAAHCFATTAVKRGMVPLVGRLALVTEADRDVATERWVEAIKLIPACERENAMAALAAALDVPLPAADVFQHLYLNWAEVKTLAQRDSISAGTPTHIQLLRVYRFKKPATRSRFRWSG